MIWTKSARPTAEKNERIFRKGIFPQVNWKCQEEIATRFTNISTSRYERSFSPPLQAQVWRSRILFHLQSSSAAKLNIIDLGWLLLLYKWDTEQENHKDAGSIAITYEAKGVGFFPTTYLHRKKLQPTPKVGGLYSGQSRGLEYPVYSKMLMLGPLFFLCWRVKYRTLVSTIPKWSPISNKIEPPTPALPRSLQWITKSLIISPRSHIMRWICTNMVVVPHSARLMGKNHKAGNELGALPPIYSTMPNCQAG